MGMSDIRVRRSRAYEPHHGDTPTLTPRSEARPAHAPADGREPDIRMSRRYGTAPREVQYQPDGSTLWASPLSVEASSMRRCHVRAEEVRRRVP